MQPHTVGGAGRGRCAAACAHPERRRPCARPLFAQREVRELQLRLGQLAGSDLPGGEDPVDLQRVAFPMRPIGILRSCFGKRNGTPRQPLLVPAARATITLRCAPRGPRDGLPFVRGRRQQSSAAGL